MILYARDVTASSQLPLLIPFSILYIPPCHASQVSTMLVNSTGYKLDLSSLIGRMKQDFSEIVAIQKVHYFIWTPGWG